LLDCQLLEFRLLRNSRWSSAFRRLAGFRRRRSRETLGRLKPSGGWTAAMIRATPSCLRTLPDLRQICAPGRNSDRDAIVPLPERRAAWPSRQWPIN